MPFPESFGGALPLQFTLQRVLRGSVGNPDGHFDELTRLEGLTGPNSIVDCGLNRVPGVACPKTERLKGFARSAFKNSDSSLLWGSIMF